MYSANRFTQRPACRLISVLLALGLTLGLFAGCQKKTVDAEMCIRDSMKSVHSNTPNTGSAEYANVFEQADTVLKALPV